MKLKILKNVSLTGKIEISLFIDGKLRMMNCKTSRELTGTVSHNDKGVFEECKNSQGSSKHDYGDFSKVFFFNDLCKEMTPKKYVEVIIDRIRDIQNWVKECKKVFHNSEHEEEI